MGPLESGSIAEAVVLMLSTKRGRLDFEWNMPAVAALIDLVLAGRIGSVPNTSFFAAPGSRKLVVLDPTPTDDPALDSALGILASRATPFEATKAIAAVRHEVTRAVHSTIEGRGLAHLVGPFSSRGYLCIDDAEGFAHERDRLALIRSRPESVTDPRTGAFIDVLRNGALSYRGEQGVHPRIRWEWYPPGVRDTVDSILIAEIVLFSSS